MKTIKLSELKKRCFTVLTELDSEGIVVTKHGKPIARVLPYESGCAHLVGSLKGKLKIKGDLLTTGLKWNARP